MKVNYTDATLPAICEHIDRQLARGDIVTLTRAQIEALLASAVRDE